MWMSINLAENLGKKKKNWAPCLVLSFQKRNAFQSGILNSSAPPFTIRAGRCWVSPCEPLHLLIHQCCLCCCGDVLGVVLCLQSLVPRGGCSAGAAEACPSRDVCSIAVGLLGDAEYLQILQILGCSLLICYCMGQENGALPSNLH